MSQNISRKFKVRLEREITQFCEIEVEALTEVNARWKAPAVYAEMENPPPWEDPAHYPDDDELAATEAVPCQSK